MRLRFFDEPSVDALLDRSGSALSSDDRHFIRRIAGRHPYLLQAMTAAMLETTGNDRQVRAVERFYEQISFHFDDLWRTLDDDARIAAIILSLVELGGSALGQDFSYGEIERVDSFGPQLRKLAEKGLAERVGEGWSFDWEHLLLWRGERWAVSTPAFAWWVPRTGTSYDEWLTKNRYHFLLTKEQWDSLLGTARSAPEWAARGVGRLAQTLFDELFRMK